MLTEIHIADVASYTPNGQSLTALKANNFIFGTNGSGKTTISRLIADPTSYPKSSIVWAKGAELNRLVYNRDFAERSYAPQMPGIFTLGQAEKEQIEAIAAKRAEVDVFRRDIDNLNAVLNGADQASGKRGELRDARRGFEDVCWGVKAQHEPHFQAAFEGARNAKAKFCDRLLAELKSNTGGVHSIEDLKKRALTVFASGITELAPLPNLSGADLIGLEGEPVLQKKIVGKEDIDIAALIRRLGNSDWVRHGLTYVNDAGAQCPFCQQDIDKALLAQLNSYFDEAYLADIGAIDRVRDSYSALRAALLERLREIQGRQSAHLDAEAFGVLVDRLEARLDINTRILERKRRESSVAVALEPIAEFVEPLIAAVAKANADIATHNALVANLGRARDALVADIWKCVLDGAAAEIGAYSQKADGLEKAIAGIGARIEGLTAQHAGASAALAELEKKVTSVEPVVTEINAILASFGFNNFRLRSAGEQKHLYEIVRADGTDATNTLSEGERSFILFLYFYHLIEGSTTTTGMNADRVVVFDDPVSSLDSDVLFIVSSLIKKVMAQAALGNSAIKQVFLLTHNIYFHKEASFNPRRSGGCLAEETFWVVRKLNDNSVVVGHDTNPIKTSYELMWHEVRNPQQSALTLQNTLRRIIEHYFQILGNTDKDKVIEKFEGRDKQICASLYAWVNDGSHNFQDDLYVSSDAGVAERFLDVFRRIFEVTEHTAHYNMMMGAEALAKQAIVQDNAAPAKDAPEPADPVQRAGQS